MLLVTNTLCLHKTLTQIRMAEALLEIVKLEEKLKTLTMQVLAKRERI